MTTETTTPTTIERSELTGTYSIDPSHSRFGFVARHAMVTKVRGGFNEFEGTLEVDGEEPTRSSGQITIQAKSIDTRSEDRDAHLRSNDFFAMDEYPEIRFQSTGIEAKGDDTYQVTGDLTIRGETRSVTFDTEFTGAATQLTEGYLCNPYDVESTANAIMKAIESPEDDRRERMTSMWDEVRVHDVHAWARRFLKTLADVK